MEDDKRVDEETKTREPPRVEPATLDSAPIPEEKLPPKQLDEEEAKPHSPIMEDEDGDDPPYAFQMPSPLPPKPGIESSRLFDAKLQRSLGHLQDLQGRSGVELPNLHQLTHFNVFNHPQDMHQLSGVLMGGPRAETQEVPTLAKITPEIRKDLKRQLQAGDLLELTFRARTFRALYPNANYVRFRDEDLDEFFASFTKQPFLRNHNTWNIESRDGTIVDSTRQDGTDLVQDINITTTRGLLSFIEGQVDRFSIGWYWSSITCSVCGNDWYDWRNCSHWPGRTYEIKGEDDKLVEVLCEVIFENPRGKETSAVNVPAVSDTGLLDALHTFAECKDALCCANAKEHFKMSNEKETRRYGASSPTGTWSSGSTTQPAAEATLEESDEPAAELTGAERKELEELRALKAAREKQEKADKERNELSALRKLENSQFDERVQAGIGDQLADAANMDPAQISALFAAAQEWKQTMEDTIVKTKLSESGLRPESQQVILDNLKARGPFTPDDLDAAIDQQKRALAAELDLHTVKGIHPNVTGSLGDRIIGVTDGIDTLSNHVEWAFGAPDAKLPPANQRDLKDMYLALTGDHEWQQQFNEEWALANANTDTFTGMAVNALNKVVSMYYDNQTTYKWFEKIVEILPHDATTQPIQLIMVDGTQLLPTVAEGGTYLEMQVGDSRETMEFSKKGSFVGITIEMIRRSDIARIRAIPKNLVNSSCRTRSMAVAQFFLANAGTGPVMADDGLPLFHANHGNISNEQYSATTWANARQRIWKQEIPNTGSRLSLWPRYALLPVDLYDTALATFGMGQGANNIGTPTETGNAQMPNVYGVNRPMDMRPIPVPVPEFTEADHWAYITDPREHAPLKMAYANSPNGQEHPMPELYQVRSQTSGLLFTNDVLPIKVRDWWAVGISTYIGIGKNNV